MLHFFQSKRDKKDKRIFSAAEYGDWQTVAYFLDRDYPVNYPDPDTGMTLLEFAKKQNVNEIISQLQEVYGALDKATLVANSEIQAITCLFERSTLNVDKQADILRPKPLKATEKRRVRFAESLTISQATQQLEKLNVNDTPPKEAKRTPSISSAIRS